MKSGISDLKFVESGQSKIGNSSL